MKTFKDVDHYLLEFPPETKVMLQELRECIVEAAPEAEEVISYGMPAYKHKGMLVYFAGYKGHIGFYPTGSGIAAFQKELKGYKCSKGTAQFPLDKPLPLALVRKIVAFRVRENEEKNKKPKSIKLRKE